MAKKKKITVGDLQGIIPMESMVTFYDIRGRLISDGDTVETMVDNYGSEEVILVEANAYEDFDITLRDGE